MDKTISKIPIDTAIPAQLIQRITPAFAKEYGIVPYEYDQDVLHFYCEKETQIKKTEIEMLLGYNVRLTSIDSSDLTVLLSKHYRQQESQVSQVDIRDPNTFVDNLIAEAKHLGSSDIHIEIYEKNCRVRYRVDGHLIEKYSIPEEIYPSIVNKLKIKANLDIAEKRLPQDGRIIFRYENVNIDIRTSILPTLHGEKIVMRLLNNDASNLDIEQLGIPELEKGYYLDGIRKTSGIVLISGPTGSGKTTTLYATLKVLNKEKTNIVTVEDPIEYTLEGINQVQVNESIGLSFSGALRSFLRQDPDIIMLGEIRDVETANMAIRASLTGHLVLSTIHTNSAWGTITRLLDMGVPPFMLASTVSVTVAQRLVRMLCKDCKQEISYEASDIPNNWAKNKKLSAYSHNGCEKCFYTGYKGRRAIYEIIPINDVGREMIKTNHQNPTEYMQNLVVQGLSASAFQLFITGQTSLDEVYSYLLNQ